MACEIAGHFLPSGVSAMRKTSSGANNPCLVHAGKDMQVLSVAQNQLPLGRHVRHARLQRLVGSVGKAGGGHCAAGGQ